MFNVVDINFYFYFDAVIFDEKKFLQRTSEIMIRFFVEFS